jgi:hypothetical protein
MVKASSSGLLTRPWRGLNRKEEEKAMKVRQAQVEMGSQYLATERYEFQESLRFWVGDGDPSTNEAAQDRPLLQIQDQITLSSCTSSEECTGYRREDLLGKDIRNEIIRLLLEKLTGRKIKIVTLSDLEPKRGSGEMGPIERSPAVAEGSAGFGLAYDKYETYRETQSLQFVSRGVLMTEDGREIRFELQFAMEHIFSATEHTEIRMGDAQKMDPLVVDLNGQAAVLSNATFSFDIDSDGVEETLASLGPGKGFLAMDRNGDGMITDGTELFGPHLDDGFLELAGLDEDGNGWVDENELGFKSLGIWGKDPQGKDTFLSMNESGIGAIYTGRIATPFFLKDEGNDLKGELKESGLYLKEDGSAGVIQELDLVI